MSRKESRARARVSGTRAFLENKRATSATAPSSSIDRTIRARSRPFSSLVASSRAPESPGRGNAEARNRKRSERSKGRYAPVVR
jgi:hypothetical protein